MTFSTRSYAQLRAGGATRRWIAAQVRSGALIRVRKGTYADAAMPDAVLSAVMAGGRIDCVSYLALLGVYTARSERPHVQMDYGTPRVDATGRGVIRHWRATTAGRDDACADLIEALAQACRCQEPRHAIATLDSAWHLGLVEEEDIAEVFRRLPARFAVMRPLLDPRAESGPESLTRLLIRQLGADVALQVVIRGVGRVDLLIDGWLIVECDSEAFHGGWDAQRRDSRRDLAAAALGYTTIRPIAEDILHHPEVVLAAIRGLLQARAMCTTTPIRRRRR